jgi:nucleoside 2-deoxyribosyltransferase
LIESDRFPVAPNIGLRLTFDGWAEYERLRQDVVESKTAFMAMSFGNATLSKILTEFFIPAVRETGFDLFRLDARPKAGVIDNRMRVEIRTAKFLVCDLTDENRGAYWEAGYAEGAQKPVFYTCERSKFEETKSHFDTEHMFTIKWDKAEPENAADELKAAIRNQFPAEAIAPDLTRGT